MTAYTVTSGAASAGITLNSGDTLTVLAGGTADDIVVANGGIEIVLTGGATTGTFVRPGGIVQLQGGTALSTTVSALGQIQISNGGIGSDTTLVLGGVDDVFGGGTAISTTVHDSSVQIVWNGGTASGTDVQGGGSLIQVPGATVVNPTFEAGAADITSGVAVLIATGGVATTAPGITVTDMVVTPGLPAFVLPGGIVYSAGIAAGAELDVWSNGVAGAVTVFGSGALGVHTGGSVTSSLIIGDGLEEVFSGGSVVSADVASGGHLFLNGGSGNLLLVSGAGSEILIESGGVGTQITDQTSGIVVVGNGGQSISTEVFPGAQLIVSSGGGAEVSYINSGAAAFAFSGGLLSSFYISSGGNVVLSGGESDFATIAFGGTETIGSGGSAINSQIYGDQIISAGGSSEQALAIGSGNIFVFSGGQANSIEVVAGGYAAVSSGGALDGLTLIGVPLVAATISGGGTLIAQSGATISGGIEFGVAGGEYVTSNTTALTTLNGFVMGDLLVAAALPFLSAGSATLDSSDLLTVTQGGNTFTAQFDNSLTGDTLAWTADPIAGTDIELVPTVISLTAPQTENSLQLSNTQILDVNSGTAANETAVSSGATVNIFNDGSTYYTILYNGGTQNVFSGGLAQATAALGGFENVSSGGTATGSVIYRGAVQSVLSGGLATGTILGEFGTPGGIEQVANGGTVIGTTIGNLGILTVSPGDIVSATTIKAGGTLVVASGATASGATINAGASVVVSSGGVLLDPVVAAGLMFVSSGATVVDPATGAGGYIAVLPGGIVSGQVASGSNVISTGVILLQNGNVAQYGPELDGLSIPYQGSPEYVLAGGVTDASRVYAGGAEYVLGGLANFTAVSGTGEQIVYAGGTANATKLNAGGEEVVSSGGMLIGGVTFAGSGGVLVVPGPTTAGTPLSGFNDTDTLDVAGLPFVAAGSGTLGSGYVLTVQQGTQTFTAQFDASIANGTFGWSADGNGGTDIKVLYDTLFVSGVGNTSSGIVLSAGANIEVYSGGITNATTLNAGAAEYVSAGGTALATDLNYNGDQYIYSGGVVSGTVFNQGTQVVESGGVDSGTTVYNGSEVLSSGGTAINDTLTNGGGLTILGGASASGTKVNFQGGETVASGGIAVGGTVIYGGNIYIASGGSAISTTLSSGDGFTVSSGGTAIDTILVAGGGIAIQPGAIVSGTIVQSGGSDGLGSGATDTGTIIQAFGSAVVSAGGTSVDTVISSGGLERILSGGVASDTIIDSGGVLVVSSGGTAYFPSFDPGGEIIVLAGGTIVGVPTGIGTVVSTGDVVVAMGSGVISQGPSFTGLTVQSGQIEYVLSGGTNTGTTVLLGGIESIDAGGSASGTTLVQNVASQNLSNLPAEELVASGGVAIATIEQYLTQIGVKPGGVVSNILDESGGGFYYLSMGGTALDVNVHSGTEYVFGGGTASGNTVDDTGGIIVFGGGLAVNTVISSGGVVETQDNGVVSNTTIAGGELDLAAGGAGNQNFQGIASGSITFKGAGGALLLENAPGMNATVSGFAPGDTIALVDTWPATATLGSGNLLSVSGNGQSYAIQLDPTQNFSADTFKVTSGGIQYSFADVADITVAVAPANYRHASGTVVPVTDYVRVGSPGTVAITVSNTAAADGLSENLLGSLAGVTGAVAIAAAGPTTEIAAGSSDSSSLKLDFSTTAAGTISGTATVDLTSDGGTGSSSIDGLGTTALTPQTVPVSIVVENPATPVFQDVSNVGTFGGSGTAYTLNLGTLTLGSGPLTVDLGLINQTTGPADTLTGTLTATGSSAFLNSGLASIGTLAAGQSDLAPAITLSTGTAGAFAETITLTGTGTDPGGTIALPKDTLTVSGIVAPPPAPPAVPAVLTTTPINFGTVHVGATEQQTLNITNAATGTAAALDASVQSVSGAATASGSFSGLVPGAENTGGITVGLNTGTAGVQSGNATLAFVSDAGTLGITDLPSGTVAVSGTVYREAAAALLPLMAIVHIGDPGTIALPVGNSDPSDGYSENLIAVLIGASGGLSVAAAGPTGEIAAGDTNSSTLALAFSTTQAGTVSGSVTVGLTSDGGTGADSIDGLGTTALTAQVVPVTISVDNYAAPVLSSNGSLIATGTNSYVLNLGTATEGAASLSANLALGNSATGAADWLDGGFTASGSAQFNNAGLVTVSEIAAGASLAAGDVSLTTNQTGVFTETITLTPTDANAADFSSALTQQSITVTGTIVPPTGTAQGDVHMVTYDGLRYDFQAVGDYVLTRSTAPGDSFQVQIATAAAPALGAVSITTEAAAQVGPDVVSFAIGRNNIVWIDGAPDIALNPGNPTQQLGGGQLTELSPTSFRLTWSTGEALTITDSGAYLNSAASIPVADGPGSVQGLLGGDSGQANDFQLADGTVLRQPLSNKEILGEFANAWQVTPAASLLGDVPMQFIYTSGPGGQTVLQATAAGQILSAGAADVLSDADGLGVTFQGSLAALGNETIAGFSAKDLIDVSGLNSASAAVVFSGSAAGGVLRVSDGIQSGNIQLSGQISGGGFHVTSDGHGGSLIALS